MVSNSIAQAVLKRDRNVVLAGLTAVVIVATIYTVTMAKGMAEPAGMLHPGSHAAHSFWMLFAMWTVMQIAMMSPTAVPMLLMHAKVERHQRPRHHPYVATMLFFLGYIVVWTAFSAVFAGIHLGLQSAALLTPTTANVDTWLAAAILIAAGLFQFSSLKQACLSQCRSPVTYLMTAWHSGRTGALVMGVKHGVHCVGCCWILMALLFVAGVMNLLWMVIITAIVLIEKVTARGELFGRIAGIGFIAWGILLLV